MPISTRPKEFSGSERMAQVHTEDSALKLSINQKRGLRGCQSLRSLSMCQIVAQRAGPDTMTILFAHSPREATNHPEVMIGVVDFGEVVTFSDPAS